MNFDKYTDRSRGFVQSAQSLALREGHQQFSPEAPAQGAARRSRRARRRADRPLGGQFAPGACRRRGGARQAAENLRRRRRAGLSRSRPGAGLRCRREGGREGRRQLRHVSSACCWRWRSSGSSEAGKILANAGVTPQNLNAAIEALRKGRTAELGLGRERLRCAQEICPRPHPGGARRQARSGDRARRGNPPHHPGAVAPDQEQSGADRRARASARPRSSRVSRCASSTATCRKASRTRSCSRSTWAR